MNKGSIIDTLQQQGGFITTGEVKSRGEYEQLRHAAEEGNLVRIRKGVYAETSALANNMIDVERIVPRGVLCLYSAFPIMDCLRKFPRQLASPLMPGAKFVCLTIQS